MANQNNYYFENAFHLPLILAHCRRSKYQFLDSDFYEAVNFLEKRTRQSFFCKGKVRKNVAWQRVAEKFNEKSQVKVTGEQSCNKWKKLKEKFKKVQEHNKKTGSDRKDMEFQEELAEFFGSDPQIIPLSTISTITAGKCEGDLSLDEDGSAQNEPPKKKRK